MAIDLKNINEFPYIKTISVDTSTTQIELPSAARTVKIGSEASILYIAQNGATDGGVIPADRVFVPAGNIIDMKLGIGLQRKNIFVATKSGTGSATILLEEQ